jgi:hypothetical protein
MDLRCGNGILFGTVEDGVLEVKCRSNRCGHEAGSVVLHRFDLMTGELQGTLKFKNPANRKEEDNATRHQSSLRSA